MWRDLRCFPASLYLRSGDNGGLAMASIVILLPSAIPIGSPHVLPGFSCCISSVVAWPQLGPGLSFGLASVVA